MGSKQHIICVTRTKPRHPPAPQIADLEASGCSEVASLDDADGLERFLDRVRRGDVVKVRDLHLLVPTKRRTDDNPRETLWRIVHRIENTGATIIEVRTGRTSTDQRERDAMIADAIEVVTRGARAQSAKLARQNGKMGGRPPTVISDEQRDRARALWFEQPGLVGVRLARSLRRIGVSRARCYREFGPRGGRN